MDAFSGRIRGRVDPGIDWTPTYQLPADAEHVPGLLDHLTAPVRILKEGANGRQRGVYEEGSNPDHYFHAGVYAQLASEIASGEDASLPEFAVY